MGLISHGPKLTALPVSLLASGELPSFGNSSLLRVSETCFPQFLTDSVSLCSLTNSATERRERSTIDPLVLGEEQHSWL